MCKLTLCFHPTCEVNWTVQSALHYTSQTTAEVTQQWHFKLVHFSVTIEGSAEKEKITLTKS